MKFENKELKVTFEIPDVITVRQQLKYMSYVRFTLGEEHYLALWEGAKLLMTEWECESIPKLAKYDLDKAEDFADTHIIIWVGNQVSAHVFELTSEKKTS